MTVIGETLDDGEIAFDKSAKILGLPYPGGPLIDKFGRQGNKHKFTFGKHKVGELNFSFSGIKTSILRVIEKGIEENSNFIENNIEDLCEYTTYYCRYFNKKNNESSLMKKELIKLLRWRSFCQFIFKN